MKPDWHWTNKVGDDRDEIIKKISVGWSNLIFNKKDRIKCICQYEKCKKEFEVKRSKIKNGRGKYCSKSCSAKAHLGINSFHWKGGLTDEKHKIRESIEYRLWRHAVFARDNWICQKCLKQNKYLRAHHINNFAQYLELRTCISNGITFCKEDHNEFHRRFGIKNNTKEQVEEFLNIKE